MSIEDFFVLLQLGCICLQPIKKKEKEKEKGKEKEQEKREEEGQEEGNETGERYCEEEKLIFLVLCQLVRRDVIPFSSLLSLFSFTKEEKGKEREGEGEGEEEEREKRGEREGEVFVERYRGWVCFPEKIGIYEVGCYYCCYYL